MATYSNQGKGGLPIYVWSCEWDLKLKKGETRSFVTGCMIQGVAGVWTPQVVEVILQGVGDRPDMDRERFPG
ncbi:hypothetical protein AVEN_14482-1, partial [Araneus ventricosus]